nr:hypothetical protein [uncultured Romboutsia sp.]
MKKNKKIIIGISLLLITLIGGFFIFKEMNKYKSDISNLSGYVLGKGVAPDLTPEEIQALLQKKVDESKVAFSIYTEPKFKGKKGTIMFANPRYSAHNLELEVRVDNKVIIRTQKISPDQYIKDIELMGKALKKGKHNGVASIKAYDRKTDKLVGEVAVDMIITSE